MACSPEQIPTANNFTINELLGNIFCALRDIAKAIRENLKVRCSRVLDPEPLAHADISGDTTFDREEFFFQEANAVGDFNLLPPDGGAKGIMLKLWINVVGGSWDMDIDSDILLPSDTALVLPKTLTEDHRYILLLQHDGTNWMLVSIIGGYPI